MLKKLLNRFWHPVKIQNYEYFQNVWQPRAKSAKKELGVARAARETLHEVGSLIGAARCERKRKEQDLVFAHFCGNASVHDTIMDLARAMRVGDSDIVGDPRDVAHIVPPAHCIGYAIFQSEEGWTNELIEGLYKSLEVLRKNRRMMVVQTSSMLRHESYGSRHII